MYSPLNSYAYIHWILDFKYILSLLYMEEEGDGNWCGREVRRGDIFEGVRGGKWMGNVDTFDGVKGMGMGRER